LFALNRSKKHCQAWQYTATKTLQIQDKLTGTVTYEISRMHSIEVKVGCSQLETALTALPWEEHKA
jgi:hypothetical protein